MSARKGGTRGPKVFADQNVIRIATKKRGFTTKSGLTGGKKSRVKKY